MSLVSGTIDPDGWGNAKWLTDDTKHGGKHKSDKPIDKTDDDLLADKIIDKELVSKSNEEVSKARAQVPMDKYTEWYNKKYMEQWKFNPMPHIAKAELRPIEGSTARLQNISLMKYVYQYNTMDMIVVVMKLYDYYTKKETNFGTLFCELVHNMTPAMLEILMSKAMHGNVVFTFYSAMPSYISCDGEYRSQFSMYKSLVRSKGDYANIWVELEAYVDRIRIRRQWSPYTSFFYPKLEQELRNTEVEFAVKNDMVSSTLLTVAWFNAIYDEMLGITRSHVNQNFKDVFLRESAIDIEFLKSLIKKYSADEIEKFRSSMFLFGTGFRGNEQYIQCGYKMIPLNIKEVQDPMRIKYKPWREYFISNKCNDLVINCISPSFAIILDWFYIKNSRKGLFDNKSQYDRMKNSELAKNVLQVLYEAQRGTYFVAENLKSMSKTSDQIKQWISSKFKKLNEKIEEPINYSIEEIIMSEVTLGFASEYVGRTVADSISMVQTSKVYDAMIGHPFKDVGYDYFAKYIFELCYALYCINTKFSIIHGDFHLNNATIGMAFYAPPDVLANKDKLRKVVYVIDDDHQYVFPNNGYYGFVIDFSRCIINPSNYEELSDKSLPASYRLVKDEERFTASEINNLLTLYIQMFPNKLKQRDELVVLFKNHYDAVFKILTAIDLYMFSVRLSRLLKSAKMPVGKRCVELIDKINKISEHYIATEMNHLIDNPKTYSDKILSNDWPALAIIKKCFSEYNDGKTFKSIDIITDVYCYKNELTYSLSKYELFPTILKYVKYVDGREINIAAVEKKRQANRHDYEKQKEYNLEMVNYISMRHAQKLV